MDVAGWLRTLGFEKLIAAFERERIDAATLLRLDATDLKELGVGMLGERKRLLAAIRALRDDGTDDDSDDNGGEQREVSVVFADLCGFTALARRLGAEATHEILRRLFARLDEVVADHGGTVDKHIGDAVMAVFGAPRAHGDDAERAVAAALAMLDATRALARETGESLALHVGVASGNVVSARTGADRAARAELTGDAVNLAARLTDQAPPDSVLICAATRAACDDRIETRPDGLLTLKGFAAPVPAWRALAPRARQPREAEDSPIVGRVAERAQFAAAVAGMRTDGRAVAIVLRGEAGIGKSRLAAEFRRLATEAGLATHVGRFADFGDATRRDALCQITRSLLGLQSHAQPDERVAERISGDVALGELAALPLAPARQAVLAAMDPHARRDATRDALLRLVGDEAARAPLLLVFEDLHWAAPAMLDALADLIRRGVDTPVVVVLTTRPESEPTGGWRAFAGDAALVTIELGPLQPDEAHVLAAQHEALTDERRAHCVARADGHPLFLEQLLRHVQDDRPAPLPASLLSIVLARMDALAETDRAALQAAAILGQSFHLDALGFLIARPRYRADALVGAGLVRPEHDALAFRHAVIRDGAYAALLGARRRALHARAAAWFANRDRALHAEHLERAGDARASQAFATAAQEAHARHRLDEAVRLARRGMALAATPAETFPLARLLGETLRDLGDGQASLAACLSAVESAGDDAARAEALLSVAETMRIIDRLDEAFDCVRAAETLATAARRTDLLAHAAHLQGNLHFPRGESEQCREAHTRASELAEAARSPRLVALSQGGLGDAAYALGRLRTAAAHFGHCIEVARAHGLMRIEAANAPMLAFTRLLQAPACAPEVDAERAIALARDVGHLRAGIVAHHAVVLPATWRLDLSRAEAHVEEARALAKRAGAWRFEAENLAFLADIRRLQERRDEALGLLAEALDIARRTGLRYFGPIILGNLALATREPGRRAEALAEGEALLTDGALAHNRLFFHAPAIEAAIEDGDGVAIRRHADALDVAFAAEPITLSTLLVDRARAVADRMEHPQSSSARAALARIGETVRAGAWRAFLPPIERLLEASAE